MGSCCTRPIWSLSHCRGVSAAAAAAAAAADDDDDDHLRVKLENVHFVNVDGSCLRVTQQITPQNGYNLGVNTFLRVVEALDEVDDGALAAATAKRVTYHTSHITHHTSHVTSILQEPSSCPLATWH